MFYLDTDFYRYFIGREDQSVNEKVMMSALISRSGSIRIMIDIYAKHEDSFSCPQLASICSIIWKRLTLDRVLLMKMNTEESMEMRDDVWKYLREKSPNAYQTLKHSLLGKLSSSHGKLSHKLTMGGYKIAQKWIGFN